MAARRADQFVRARSYSYGSNLTSDMIRSTRQLMLAAAAERGLGVWTTSDNHASSFGPGAIVLAVTAFELLLKFLIIEMTELTDKQVQHELGKNTISMVDFLTGTLGTACPRRAELEMIIEIRNEIAHHFPRPGNLPENLPWWYDKIEARQLLIRSGRPDGDFNLSQKLGSFKLAYWVSQVIIEAVADLVRGSTHRMAAIHSREPQNFSFLLVGVPAPDSLALAR